MKLWYDTKTNQIIRVSICQLGFGGYTFYKTRYLNKQGKRVRMRPAKWFDEPGEAEKALFEYCKTKPQYKHLALNEIFRRLEALKPKKFNPLFGQWI